MTTRDVDRLIAHIIPPNDTPMRCPHCGRLPELRETAQLSWFECRKWFGFRLCTRGPEVFEGREEGEWSRRSAAYAWNRMLMQSENRKRV